MAKQLGTTGKDFLIGDTDRFDLDDFILGLEADDIIVGLRGNDTLDGGEGTDILSGGDGNDALNGDKGNDALGSLSTTANSDLVEPGDDWLGGGDGIDFISGGEGNDTELGGTGADLIGSFQYTLVPNSTAETTNIIGVDPGVDRLEGGDGNDFISGGDGNDRLFGGNDADILGSYSIRETNLSDSSRQSPNVLPSFTGNNPSFFIIPDYKSFTYVTDDAGDDVLDGGDGNDYLSGGTGNDELLGGLGSDIVGSYTGRLQVITGFTSDTSGQYTGFDSGNDRLDGGEGDDFLCGGAGDDFLQGGNGNDTLGNFKTRRRASKTSSAVDSIRVEDNSAFERVITSDNELGNDSLEGGRGNDRLTGGSGADQLVGVSSADGVTAGVGEIDTLRGGQGRDIFVLGNTTAVFYNDRRVQSRGRADYAIIQDFNRNQDRIQLKGRSKNYQISASSSRRNGIEILLKTGNSTELIAIVQGSRFNNFTQGFVFV